METQIFMQQEFHLKIILPNVQSDQVIQVLEGTANKNKFEDVQLFVCDSDEGGVLITSSLITYKKSESLKLLLKTLFEIEQGNAIPKIEIFIDGENHSFNTIRNLINIFLNQEELICKSLNVDKDCSLKFHLINRVMSEEIKNVQNFDELKQKWDAALKGLNDTNLESQQVGIDLEKWITKKQITFRYIVNNLDNDLATRISMGLIIMSLAINSQALISKRSNLNIKERENEKFSFRTWLNRIGLKGIRFKSERNALLKNLDGDSAWRSGTRPKIS